MQKEILYATHIQDLTPESKAYLKEHYELEDFSDAELEMGLDCLRADFCIYLQEAGRDTDFTEDIIELTYTSSKKWSVQKGHTNLDLAAVSQLIATMYPRGIAYRNSHSDLVAQIATAQGMTKYIYRCWKPELSEKQKQNFLDAIARQDVNRDKIAYYTAPIPCIKNFKYD
jgi:hypothetical protein